MPAPAVDTATIGLFADASPVTTQAYQVLARKWRPRDFSTLVGQEHVVRALSHALEQQRLHHAYLFTGTRGVGKTTLARILAKALNCETGITAHPCGQCQTCREIDGGRFVDLLEVDAATNTRVDEMRQLLENAVYAPTAGRYKVYVIDEVHMLSNAAFNAMLKTLEEPPPHIKFILATTDPQKIPVTVLSRCLQFNLKSMLPTAIVSHLQTILAQEQIQAEREALKLLSHAANGSMRDALSLLDQAIAYSAGVVTTDAVQGMLGAIDQTYLHRLLAALAAADGVALMAIADEMTLRSLSYRQALGDLATLLQRIALAQTIPQAIPEEWADAPTIAAFATQFSAEDIQLYYQIVLHGRNDLSLAPDELTGFSMTLLRLLAFKPSAVGNLPAADIATTPLPKKVASPTVPPHAISASAGQVSQPAAGPQHTRASASLSAQSVSTEMPVASATVALPVVAPPAPASAPLLPGQADSIDWPTLVLQLNVTGLAKQLATQSELLSVQGSQYVIRTAAKPLSQGSPVEKLRQALSEYYQQPIRLQVEVGEVQSQTAQHRDETARSERQQAAEQAIQQDPLVQGLLAEFDATIVPNSIRPV
ncbi:DNA polymerase III subunit gamma/tau [Parvibium lacunae]|uniref:DNA polymerase III subunit gamma/tau n=2 Tax=Parvibium lacunae TaxID=1888893 RepID=A0A368L3U5_9BURK|nr:DNA polymerase III subunit gamma/tau [Parvibium lacunae]